MNIDQKGSGLEVGSIDDDWVGTKMNFDVHRAVHHNIIPIVNPNRCTSVSNLFTLEWHSTCFGRSFHPSSGVQDCTYSNRHLSNRYFCLLASKQTAVSVWLLYVPS